MKGLKERHTNILETSIQMEKVFLYFEISYMENKYNKINLRN